MSYKSSGINLSDQPSRVEDIFYVIVADTGSSSPAWLFIRKALASSYVGNPDTSSQTFCPRLVLRENTLLGPLLDSPKYDFTFFIKSSRFPVAIALSYGGGGGDWDLCELAKSKSPVSSRKSCIRASFPISQEVN